MNTFYIVLLTLIIYSTMSTIIIELMHENENVIAVFGFGVIGCWLILISKVISKINNLFKYHIGKRSIFEKIETGSQYKCKVKDAYNIEHWIVGYKMVKRYATKSEWINIPNFTDEFMRISKINCDNCKYDKCCECDFPYKNIKCKHDNYGKVIEFDMFESK